MHELTAVIETPAGVFTSWAMPVMDLPKGAFFGFYQAGLGGL
jgi:hypothetical protein